MRVLKYILLIIILFLAKFMIANQNCDSLYFAPIIKRANTHQNSHQHIKVISLVDSLTNVTKFHENCKYYLILLNLKGLALENSQKFEESSQVLAEVIKMAQKYNYFEIEAKSYLIVVRIHDFLKRESDLRRNLAKAKALVDQYKLYNLLPEYYVRSSSSQRFFGTRDSSIYFANQAVFWGEKFHDHLNLADAYLLLGAANRGLPMAKEYMKKSAGYYKKNGSFSSVALQYLNLISILDNEGKLNEAGSYIDSAKYYLTNVEKNPRVFTLNSMLNELISLKFQKEGIADSSVHYIKLAKLYSDSSNFATNQEYISEKEIEIATLKEKSEIEYLAKSRKYWVLGFASLLGIIIVLIYFYFSKLKFESTIASQRDEILIQKNELDKLLQKQTILLSEVHHRVKNNLQVVISLLTLKSHHVQDENLVQYLNDICLKIRSISLIHDQLYHTNQFDKILLKIYIDQLCEQFIHMYSQNDIMFNIEIDENLVFNIETLFPIGIIISELTTNTVKHAQIANSERLNISISVEKNQNTYQLKYSDNGKGKLSNEKGLGSTILKSMTRQLNGSSNEFNQNGYHFQLSFIEKITSNLGYD